MPVLIVLTQTEPAPLCASPLVSKRLRGTLVALEELAQQRWQQNIEDSVTWYLNQFVQSLGDIRLGGR